jgi:flavin-dependent thymidylate synthase
MKVTLIDYTGAGNPDPLYAARLLVYTKNTRLTQGEDTRKKVQEMNIDQLQKELSYVANTIRSSWEFVDFTFEITGVTRAFTHQLVRTRTASYAQQAQRVVDMSDFEALLPVTVVNKDKVDAWEACMRVIRDVYQNLTDAGVPAQDARGVLPTNVLTNIIVKMNLRTLADLLGKRKSLRAQGEYADVAREWERQAVAVFPWTQPFLDPERTRTPALDAILKEALGSAAPIDAPRVNAALKELDTLKGTWG